MCAREGKRVWRSRFQPSAATWTLGEMLVAVLLAAVAAKLAATGNAWFATLLATFVLATRIAVVDYSLIGSAATSLVMVSGVLLIFVATFWTLS